MDNTKKANSMVERLKNAGETQKKHSLENNGASTEQVEKLVEGITGAFHEDTQNKVSQLKSSNELTGEESNELTSETSKIDAQVVELTEKTKQELAQNSSSENPGVDLPYNEFAGIEDTINQPIQNVENAKPAEVSVVQNQAPANNPLDGQKMYFSKDGGVMDQATIIEKSKPLNQASVDKVIEQNVNEIASVVEGNSENKQEQKNFKRIIIAGDELSILKERYKNNRFDGSGEKGNEEYKKYLELEGNNDYGGMDTYTGSKLHDDERIEIKNTTNEKIKQLNLSYENVVNEINKTIQEKDKFYNDNLVGVTRVNANEETRKLQDEEYKKIDDKIEALMEKRREADDLRREEFRRQKNGITQNLDSTLVVEASVDNKNDANTVINQAPIKQPDIISAIKPVEKNSIEPVSNIQNQTTTSRPENYYPAPVKQPDTTVASVKQEEYYTEPTSNTQNQATEIKPETKVLNIKTPEKAVANTEKAKSESWYSKVGSSIKSRYEKITSWFSKVGEKEEGKDTPGNLDDKKKDLATRREELQKQMDQLEAEETAAALEDAKKFFKAMLSPLTSLIKWCKDKWNNRTEKTKQKREQKINRKKEEALQYILDNSKPEDKERIKGILDGAKSKMNTISQLDSKVSFEQKTEVKNEAVTQNNVENTATIVNPPVVETGGTATTVNVQQGENKPNKQEKVAEAIPQSDWDNYVDTGVISEENLKSIESKKEKGETLSEREIALFDHREDIKNEIKTREARLAEAEKVKQEAADKRKQREEEAKKVSETNVENAKPLEKVGDNTVENNTTVNSAPQAAVEDAVKSNEPVDMNEVSNEYGDNINDAIESNKNLVEDMNESQEKSPEELAKMEENKEELNMLTEQLNDWSAKLDQGSNSAPKAIEVTVAALTESYKKNNMEVPQSVLDLAKKAADLKAKKAEEKKNNQKGQTIDLNSQDNAIAA